jgi:paraquat-inducible protein B
MAKQVSKTVIGGFVISAIALLVIGIVIFGGGKFFTKTVKYVLYFDRSIKGLNVGAPVVFRGVEIGTVASVVIRADPDKLKVDIPVVIEIEPDRFQTTGESERTKYARDPYERAKVLIEHGLRAQLTLESLVTGQLMIEIDFYPDTPVRLTGIDAGYPELPTIPSSIEQFAETLKKVPLEEIFEKLLSAINSIEKVLSAPEVMDTVKNLEEATQNANQLILSADKMVKDADTLVLNVNRQVDPLSENLQAAIGDVRKLLQNVDGQVQPVSAKLQDALVYARQALDGARTTLATINTFAEERSAFRIKLEASLEEISAASRSVRALTEYLERHPEALLQGKSGS